MTAVDGDGIDEDLTRTVSVAMLAAARAGEQLSRMTQAAAREREACAAGDTAQAQRQLATHTESAKAYFEVVTRPEYLNVATDEQIREVARQSQAWQERLPEAQRAEQAASRELGARSPSDVPEESVVLAAEADGADRRAAELASDADRGQEPADAGDLVVSSRSGNRAGEQAAAAAQLAQARPAREAPGAGRRGPARHQAQRPARVRRKGFER